MIFVHSDDELYVKLNYSIHSRYFICNTVLINKKKCPSESGMDFSVVCMELNLQLLKTIRNLLLTLVTSKSRWREFENPSNFDLKIRSAWIVTGVDGIVYDTKLHLFPCSSSSCLIFEHWVSNNTARALNLFQTDLKKKKNHKYLVANWR